MDAKELNALVHDREAAFYDERFLIDYATIGREVRREIEDLLGEQPRVRRALDVACGTGYLALGLATGELADDVHASDLSWAMLERTTTNAEGAGADVRLTLADAEKLPYADGSFDLVVARGALHHLPDPLQGLQEIRRVLEPGGTAIILAEPTPGGERQTGTVVGVAVRAVETLRRLRRRTESEDELVRRHWELASIAANLHTFDPEGLATLAEKAGFEDIQVGTAWWSWILVLGLNYYFVGEFERIASNPIARAAARAAADVAATFDRWVADRVIPPRWRHTVQAVLR
jgi:ubiquinone/menaquinone biosynthesis C-methylase UbiE